MGRGEGLPCARQAVLADPTTVPQRGCSPWKTYARAEEAIKKEQEKKRARNKEWQKETVTP